MLDTDWPSGPLTTVNFLEVDVNVLALALVRPFVHVLHFVLCLSISITYSKMYNTR